jgi:hypothetical protein
MENATHVKEEARRLVKELPENVSWADFTRLVLERQRVEEGLADLDAGVSWTSEESRESLGIPTLCADDDGHGGDRPLQ